MSKDTVFLSATQVARMCGVTSRTVQRWIKFGYFPGAWKGPGKTSLYHIPQSEVEAFIAQMSEQVIPDGAAQFDQPVLMALHEVLQRLEESQTGSRMTLIVEADVNAGSAFEFALKAAGFGTFLVRSGEEAISLLAAMVPDILILGHDPADTSGGVSAAEVLRHVRSNPQLAGLPVIVTTADPEPPDEIQKAANLVLTKPVHYGRLRNEVLRLVRA